MVYSWNISWAFGLSPGQTFTYIFFYLLFFSLLSSSSNRPKACRLEEEKEKKDKKRCKLVKVRDCICRILSYLPKLVSDKIRDRYDSIPDTHPFFTIRFERKVEDEEIVASLLYIFCRPLISSSTFTFPFKSSTKMGGEKEEERWVLGYISFVQSSSFFLFLFLTPIFLEESSSMVGFILSVFRNLPTKTSKKVAYETSD